MNIEALAYEKDFAALSTAEQDLVLAEMPQEEFEHLHAVLRAARQMDNGLKVPAHLKAKLLAKMAMQTKPGGFVRVWKAKMPVWQAFLLAGFGIMLLLNLKKDKVQEKIIPVLQVRVDTVWKEKTIWRDRIVLKERVVFKEKNADIPIALLQQPMETAPFIPGFSEPEFSAPRVGTSLGDTPELMRFFTEGDK